MDSAQQAQTDLTGVRAQPIVARDLRFDILKTIGIFCIILAHVIPEKSVLFQLRNFDVPLMVMVSGALFYLSSRNKEYAFLPYLTKRVLRLLPPVWFFLIFFFAATYMIHASAGREFPYSLFAAAGSFTLLSSFNYVWIIRVFILVAMLSPLILKLRRACSTPAQFLLAILLAYGGYELLLQLVGNLESPLASGALDGDLSIGVLLFAVYFVFLQKILFPAVSYGCLFAVGMVLPEMRRKTVLLLAIAATALFAALAVHTYTSGLTNQLISTQAYKYPPQLYFVSYGVAVSSLLYLMIDKLHQKHGNVSVNANPIASLVVFISASTMWIYLWHILFVENIWIFPFRENYVLLFLTISALAIGLTYLQKQLVQSLIANTKFGQNNAEFLSVLFLK